MDTGTVRRERGEGSNVRSKEKPGDFAPLYASTTFDLRNTRIWGLFRRLDCGIVCSGSVTGVHLRQRADGGESHIDYALNTFSERFVGAGDGLKGGE